MDCKTCSTCAKAATTNPSEHIFSPSTVNNFEHFSHILAQFSLISGFHLFVQRHLTQCFRNWAPFQSWKHRPVNSILRTITNFSSTPSNIFPCVPCFSMVPSPPSVNFEHPLLNLPNDSLSNLSMFVVFLFCVGPSRGFSSQRSHFLA